MRNTLTHPLPIACLPVGRAGRRLPSCGSEFEHEYCSVILYGAESPGGGGLFIISVDDIKVNISQNYL